jgi:uncharacterized protein (DUF1015 family)
MATVHPFRALRPRPSDASRVAAVPYDVVGTDEARALASDNPLSFLRVSRAEIELPASVGPYSDAVYQRAVQNFDRLKKEALVLEDEPSVYLYRLRMRGHEQIGLAACYALADYDSNVIKKHERTRPDKEDDRTRHMLALGAQTGPVFLTYRASEEVDRIVERAVNVTGGTGATGGGPLFDFDAPDAVHHSIWRISGADRDALVSAFSRIPALYIADGHHRAASAARARADIGRRGSTGTGLGDGADYNTMLGVAFPHDQVQILPYNRIVKGLGGLSPDAFLAAVGRRFEIDAPENPAARGEISMYFGGRWSTLRPRVRPSESDAIASLDVSLLQDQLLAPVLGIFDVRTDKRIDFVSGARGTSELAALVDSGRASVAFSMYPVTVGELMAVADAGAIMPPKSTWFEPKLRDGLLIHVI